MASQSELITTQSTLKLLEECEDKDTLWRWLKQHLNLHIPRRSFCPHHNAPFDYIDATYFEPSQDLIVHGPRGGGKTRLAAAATLLDLLHKPGINIRVLGGSLEQSLRVWEHLVPDIQTVAADQLAPTRSNARRLDLLTGSKAAVLTQSQRNVRGQRVQKMRCDEVEMFDKSVWSAVGATTRSLKAQMSSGEKTIAGVIEALSTHHEPYGLMSDILDEAVLKNTRIIRWCILDVLAKCEPDRDCNTCPLFKECQGRAKQHHPDGTPVADGFVSVDDVIRIKSRLSEEKWEAEMLCLRPTKDGLVFPTFAEDLHVRAFEPTFPLSLGIDFGFSAPFVALVMGKDTDGKVHIYDEYIVKQKTVEMHAAALRARYPDINTIYCDPAGKARNDQTGQSSVNLLRQLGYQVHANPSPICNGLELIRMLCRDANGRSHLYIHPRCKELIKALKQYHYPKAGNRELPHKDGENDHPIDAFRYWIIHNARSGLGKSRAT